MVTDAIIRSADEEDLSAILQLYAQPDYDDGNIVTMEYALDQFHKIKRYPNFNIYVATLAGLVVGTYTLLIADSIAHMGAPAGIVEDVVVAQNKQGQGIGKKMMWHAMEQCRKAGCFKLSLSSHNKRIGAHRFYESLGFTKHGYSFLVKL
jgi:GNAT superfamily N-acetyltransferase